MFLAISTIHHQYTTFFFNFIWLRSQLTGDRLRHWALVAAITLGSVIGLQLLYPSSLALPQTRISGEKVGLNSRNKITQKIQDYAVRDITVDTMHGKQSVNPNKLGVSINPEATAKRATSYTMRERLIPLSWVFIKKNIASYESIVDTEKLKIYSTELTKQNVAPTDAVAKITETTAQVTPSVEGYAFDPEQTQTQLRSANIDNDLTVSISPKVVAPAIDTSVAEKVSTQINQRLNTPFEIEADGNKLAIDSKTLASWIVIKSDPANKTIIVDFDRAKIKAKLLTLSSKIYIAETPTRITILDGETGSNSKGLAGQALLVDASIDEVIASANGGKSNAVAKLQAITPTTQVVRSYSKSSKGLQALVTYWAQTHGGQYGITLKTLSGSIVASHNGSKKFTSASIYKLYLAYVVYDKVAAGSMRLSDVTSTGASVESCIDAMIVRSDNNCAIALGNAVGWQSNDTLLHAKGFGSTTLTSGGHLTTSNDTAAWLVGLHSGTLNLNEYNVALLSMMGRQVYRTGIPAGSKGSSVANKVGFIDGLNHDAAIIYHPKGVYVLSVMSSGSSFSQISDLAKQISTVMNQ